MTESLLRPARTSAAHTGTLVRALRRGPRESQRDFTVLLDVLARPGRIGRLDVPDGAPAAAVAACGLADVEVPLHVLTGGDPEYDAWAEAAHTATRAPRAALSAARCVVALRPLTAPDVAALHRGRPLDPERGARVFAQVDTLADASDGSPDTAAADALVLALTGPGVPGERRIAVRGLATDVVDALGRANAGFPCGVDVFLLARDASVTGLPRTTRVRLVRGV
ncbi:phosphonate C-P lyase system protein PhnH [Streptomyces shenzhenensis]|uniref:phosphonate C-P lyase system protein PhnH n=1 Tax=Streptomyces shenzhenensis TaxID=943815 RepID=UPI0033D40F19